MGLLATPSKPAPRLPTGRDLVKLLYLDAVFHESLRLFAPSPLGTSRQLAAATELGGVPLPAGTRVLIPPWAVHRSREVWGAAAKRWDPGRWLGGQSVNAVKRNADGHTRWLPFSDGGQNCIGQHLAQVCVCLPYCQSCLCVAFKCNVAVGAPSNAC